MAGARRGGAVKPDKEPPSLPIGVRATPTTKVSVSLIELENRRADPFKPLVERANLDILDSISSEKRCVEGKTNREINRANLHKVKRT